MQRYGQCETLILWRLNGAAARGAAVKSMPTSRIFKICMPRRKLSSRHLDTIALQLRVAQSMAFGLTRQSAQSTSRWNSLVSGEEASLLVALRNQRSTNAERMQESQSTSESCKVMAPILSASAQRRLNSSDDESSILFYSRRHILHCRHIHMGHGRIPCMALFFALNACGLISR